METSKYKDYVIELAPGDKLFVYSDGVPEAKNSENEMFSLERLTGSLIKYGDRLPEEIIGGVASDISEFVGDATQFDDIAMLCVEYRG